MARHNGQTNRNRRTTIAHRTWERNGEKSSRDGEKALRRRRRAAAAKRKRYY